MVKLKRINLRVDEDMWHKFSSICRANGETMTRVFNRAIASYVGKDTKRNGRDEHGTR